ncbi:MAG TPA: hypothetical protein VM597_33730 [Gemmataceae bacterium]|nr:hypothetical protein [Gemmataceae bacterium]
MVKYTCDGNPDDRLCVETDESNKTVRFAIEPDEAADGDRYLARDAVSALVGQLQSWLARTAAAGPTAAR